MRPPKNRFEFIIWEIDSVYGYVLGQLTEEYGTAPYHNPEFRNKIKPREVTRDTMELIKRKLNENLYRPEEQIHILKNSRYLNPERMGNDRIARTIELIELDPTQRKELERLKKELHAAKLAREQCDTMVMEAVQELIDELETPRKDKRKSEKEPTRAEKLRALREFAPELIKALDKADKETKGKILFLITGVNPDDAYQMLFTSRAKFVDKVKIKDLELYKEILDIDQK